MLIYLHFCIFKTHIILKHRIFNSNFLLQVNATEDHRLFHVSCVFANKIDHEEITNTYFLSKMRSNFNT